MPSIRPITSGSMPDVRRETYKGLTVRLLRYFFVWVAIVAYSTPVILLSALTLRRFTDTILPLAAKSWGRLSLKLLRIRVEFENAELLQERRPRIIIFNHESTLDILWLACVFPPAALGIVKREFIYVPFFNLALWAAKFVFIDRSNRQKAVAALQALSEKIVREKRSLLIAPEGTRTRTGEMLPFKKGAFRIAASSRIPLYPIVSAGGYALLPKPKLLPRPGVIKIRCLPPIDTSAWDPQNLDSRINEVRSLMVEHRQALGKDL